ncbi:MAG: glycosyltransferase [Candidatus Woesearchaeota archaeon]
MRSRIRKKDIPKLRVGVLHSQYGYPDGVSIVMSQVEHVMVDYMGIQKENVFYLAGKAKRKTENVFQQDILWDMNRTNRIMLARFDKGFGGHYNEIIEKAIQKARIEIEKFIKKNKIDVLIAHNASLPVNFISSIALSRYYRNAIRKGEKTPKYILWWHDGHTERKEYSNPAPDVQEYLLEGVPGKHVEYIIFINSMQFSDAEKYFITLNKRKPGYHEMLEVNHDIVYNTTSTFIESYEDLESDKDLGHVNQFLSDFKVDEKIREKNLKLEDTQFVLQHTRIVPRKRIDFAIKYCYELLSKLKKKKMHKAMYFFISGHTGQKSRQTRSALKRLNNKLAKKYGIDTFFLVFAEDYPNTKITFEEYPKIFAKLGGITTYFSEIEGFGNNLLEVLASGLVPIVYTYPVFKQDIAKFKFKVIALDKFEIDNESIKKTIDIIKNTRKRKIWVNRNLTILNKKFQHRIIQRKLTRAIIKKRPHI